MISKALLWYIVFDSMEQIIVKKAHYLGNATLRAISEGKWLLFERKALLFLSFKSQSLAEQY